MTQSSVDLSHLRRPRILIQAARFAMPQYDRAKDLGRLLNRDHLPPPQSALSLLLNEEAELDQLRKTPASQYSTSRHITVLAALLREAENLMGANEDP